MSDEACPLPTDPADDEADDIRRLLASKTVAVVGASEDPNKAGNYVPAYLKSAGFQILPINPNHATVFGEPCRKSLADLDAAPDLVLVFRRPEYCADVAREAVAVGARGLWLQSGIYSDEARQIARKAGMSYVEGRCIMVEHGYRSR